MGVASATPGWGRLYILLAAVLWSTGGGFAKVLVEPTSLGLDVPRLTPLQVTCLRSLFAGLVLVPLVRRRDVVFRPGVVAVALCFAVMSAVYVTAVVWGTSANAIFLQNTAMGWMYLGGVLFLGEHADRRSGVAVCIGLVGIVVIVWGGWQGGQLVVVLLGLGSGLTYAGVVLGLRALRGLAAAWLTVVNLLFTALVLLPCLIGTSLPTAAQLGWLFVFGAAQMGLPYWLMTRGLRTVSPQEAGTLTLLEPLLNPIWAYLATVASPRPEIPDVYTLVGGAFILGALAWRYWPVRALAPPVQQDPLLRSLDT
jgi:drug/metabolite transporter, DME family